MNKKELKNALPSIKERLSKGEKPEDIFDAVYFTQGYAPICNYDKGWNYIGTDEK